jgi:hypothetical protein
MLTTATERTTMPTLKQLEEAYESAVTERDRLLDAMTEAERRALTAGFATTEAQRQYEAACERVRNAWWEHTSLGIVHACAASEV